MQPSLRPSLESESCDSWDAEKKHQGASGHSLYNDKLSGGSSKLAMMSPSTAAVILGSWHTKKGTGEQVAVDHQSVNTPLAAAQ